MTRLFTIQIPGQYEVSLSCKTSDPEKARDRDLPHYSVMYGKQVSSKLTYSQAAKELGKCLMHAAYCDGFQSAPTIRR